MNIFWVKISKVYYEEFFENIKESKEKISVFTPNWEFLLNARFDENYKNILNQSDYNVPDGIWIWAAYQILDNEMWKFLNSLLIPWYLLNLFIKRKELYKKYGWRILWSVLTRDLVEYANLKWYWVTIIDKLQPKWSKWEEKQNNTVKDLKNKYPSIDFHFYVCNWKNLNEISENINKTDDIYLFSTQWRDKGQEKTILEILPLLNKIKVGIWVWGSFDYILGFKKRPPKIVASLWFEWLWRLATHPLRMAKRVWNVIPVFLYEVIKSKN